MNLHDALDELGLASGATADDVRRAYLRLLKVRKPEVDPDGFQRLRAAYEAAKARVAPPDAPVDTVVAVVDDAPAVPVPCVATTAPARAPVEARRAFEPPPVVDLRDAAVSMTAMFQAASRSPSASVQSAQTVLETMLRLHQRGTPDDLTASLELGRAFQHWMETYGIEARILSGHLAAAWAVLRDLAILPADVEPVVRSTIARVILEGSLANDGHALRRYAAQQTEKAERVARFMRAHTPSLRDRFAPLLSAKQFEPPATSRRAWWPYYVAAMVAVNAIRMLASNFDSPPRRAPSYDMLSDERAKLAWSDTVHPVGEVASSRPPLDCAKAAAEMPALRERISTNPTPELLLRLSQFEALVRQTCNSKDGGAP